MSYLEQSKIWGNFMNKLQLISDTRSGKRKELDHENNSLKKIKKNTSYIPQDILGIILSYSPFRSYPSLALVSKDWGSVIFNSSLFKLYDFIVNTPFYCNSKTDQLNKQLFLDKGAQIEKEIKWLILIRNNSERSKNRLYLIWEQRMTDMLRLLTENQTRKDYIYIHDAIHVTILNAPFHLSWLEAELGKIDKKVRLPVIESMVESLRTTLDHLVKNSEISLPKASIELLSHAIDTGVRDTVSKRNLPLESLLKCYIHSISSKQKLSIDLENRKSLFQLLLRLETPRIDINKYLLSQYNEFYRKDKQTTILALRNSYLFDPKRFYKYIKSWKQDYDVALASVQKDGLKLKKFSKFSDCEEIVLAAVKNNLKAIEFAHKAI